MCSQPLTSNPSRVLNTALLCLVASHLSFLHIGQWLSCLSITTLTRTLPWSAIYHIHNSVVLLGAHQRPFLILLYHLCLDAITCHIARLDPLVTQWWDSITVLLTCSHQCRRLVKKKAVHVLLCLCNNACKRSLAICRKSRALCPVSRLLSVPMWPACVKQGR